MLPILIIVIAVVILDQLINRILIKKLNIHNPGIEKKYVNKLHKHVEKIIYGVTLVVMVPALLELSHLRIFIFVGMVTLLAFRTIMKWKFVKEDKTYILSAVTCGLLITGSIVYGILDYNVL